MSASEKTQGASKGGNTDDTCEGVQNEDRVRDLAQGSVAENTVAEEIDLAAMLDLGSEVIESWYDPDNKPTAHGRQGDYANVEVGEEALSSTFEGFESDEEPQDTPPSGSREPFKDSIGLYTIHEVEETRNNKVLPSSRNAGPESVRSYRTAVSSIRTFVTAYSSGLCHARGQGYHVGHTAKTGNQSSVPSIHVPAPSTTQMFDSLVESIFAEFLSTVYTASWPSPDALRSCHNHIQELLQVLIDSNSTTGEVASLSLTKLVDTIVSRIEHLQDASDAFNWRASSDEDLKQRIGQQIYEFAVIQSRRQFQGYRPFDTQWLRYLKKRGILLDDVGELDWSGRGQHVEYSLQDKEDIPLEPKGVLGHGATAVVERVLCRRILLARKTIRCSRRLTREEAITEVEHLQRLQHKHIIRVVGTYTLERQLAILVYPVAERNLDDHLDSLAESQIELTTNRPIGYNQLLLCNYPETYKIIGCLLSAIEFIHAHNIKHMDIKPLNILLSASRVYIADFGIARAYKTVEESNTDSPISFTRAYAAPEVAAQETRGLPADIFSLGCVFMEIIATSLTTSDRFERDTLLEIRKNEYSANVEATVCWYIGVLKDVHCVTAHRDWAYLLVDMLSPDPGTRPSATFLKRRLQQLCCGNCNNGPEPFVDAREQQH